MCVYVCIYACLWGVAWVLVVVVVAGKEDERREKRRKFLLDLYSRERETTSHFHCPPLEQQQYTY